MLMYPNFQATAPWDPGHSSLHVYDVSRFLRWYRIMGAPGDIARAGRLDLMRNPAGKAVSSKTDGMPESIERALKKATVVTSPEMLAECDDLALAFIDALDRLISHLSQNDRCSQGIRLMRAYVVNEDRPYLNCRPGNDVLVALVQGWKSGRVSAAQFSRLIHLIIEAGDRIPHPDKLNRCSSDVCLFWNAFTSNLVCPDGSFHARLTLPRELQPGNSWDSGTSGAWAVEINGVRRTCTTEVENDRLQVLAPRQPLRALFSDHATTTPSFFLNGTAFELLPITRKDR